MLNEPAGEPIAGESDAVVVSRRKPRRVLVVDDDSQIVEAVHAVLAARGYEVLIARDGNQGLMRAERDAPDLIVLDVTMPRRSGLSVLEKLGYRRFNGPKVILMTAHDAPRQRAFAEANGVDFFLTKPFAMPDLVSSVDALLGD